MKQYCRYCCFLSIRDFPYCEEKKQTVIEAAAKSPNRCHNFAYNPIDAFGENEKGYLPREPKKKQCDGQIKMEVLGWKD